MATRSLFNSHSHITSRLLRKPFHLPIPIAQSTIIDEALCYPLNLKSQQQHPHSAFSLADLLGANQKLLIGEEGFLGTGGSTFGGALWARGRERRQMDSEEEVDDGDVDEFDDEDFVDEMDDDEIDGEFSEDFDDDDEEEEDDKVRRRK